MADLKETLYRKLYNISLVIIETLKPEDKSAKYRLSLSSPGKLSFLSLYLFHQPGFEGLGHHFLVATFFLHLLVIQAS